MKIKRKVDHFHWVNYCLPGRGNGQGCRRALDPTSSWQGSDNYLTAEVGPSNRLTFRATGYSY